MINWNLVSFVVRSEQRKKILPLLKNPVTPSEIAKETNFYLTHVSRALREFQDKGLVECLTPKERVGKYYRITKLGQRILKEVEKLNKK